MIHTHVLDKEKFLTMTVRREIDSVENPNQMVLIQKNILITITKVVSHKLK